MWGIGVVRDIKKFDVIILDIFNEKLLIGKSVIFLWIFIFIWKESGLDYGLELGVQISKSVDFFGVLRYWVRYLIFVTKVDEMLDFTGFNEIFI